MQALDFSSASASQTINAWVNNKTRGRIEDIVPANIPAETIMYLINAIYFKGSWTHRFDPNDTRPAPFTRLDGSTRDVAPEARNGRSHRRRVEDHAPDDTET